MDGFNLFDKDLNLKQTLEYDSLIDKGYYDPYVLLLNNPQYKPNDEVSHNILRHIDKQHMSEPKTMSENVDKSDIEPEPEPEKINKKTNIKREYIQLRDATINRHTNKYESVEA